MVDNTSLNVGAGGDSIRDLARQGGAVKTQVVQLDLGGAAANAEFLIGTGQAPMNQSIPVTRAGDQPSDPALVAIVNLLTRLFPQSDSIFSPFEDLAQRIISAIANGSPVLSSIGLYQEITITSGGNPQWMFNGIIPPNGYELINTGPAETLYWREGAPAAAAAPSAPIQIGDAYTTPSGYKPSGPISVIAATTGHTLIGRGF